MCRDGARAKLLVQQKSVEPGRGERVSAATKDTTRITLFLFLSSVFFLSFSTSLPLFFYYFFKQIVGRANVRLPERVRRPWYGLQRQRVSARPIASACLGDPLWRPSFVASDRDPSHTSMAGPLVQSSSAAVWGTGSERRLSPAGMSALTRPLRHVSGGDHDRRLGRSWGTVHPLCW